MMLTFATVLRYTPLIALAALCPVIQAQDLNANSIEDPRDLREGFSEDCNANGVVDERDATAPHFGQAIEHLNALEGTSTQNNVWDAQPIDFNQDGLPDLIVTSMFSTNVGAISYWRNEGGAGLVHVQRDLIPDTRPYSLRVADLNGDGLEDFVTSDASFNNASVYFATGPEEFAPPLILDGPAANNGSVGLDLGDLNGDGLIDIAFSTWYPSSINVFYNTGKGSFITGPSFPADNEPRDIAIGDVDGDGLNDIVAANEDWSGHPATSDGTVSVHRNTGKGGFEQLTSLTFPDGNEPWTYRSEPHFVALADVDQDTDLDLITSSMSSNVLTIHENDGGGVFTLAQTFGGISVESEGRDVLLRDFDGDGWIDLAWGDTDQHIVGIYRNNNGVFEHHQNYAAVNYGPQRLAAADFNSDGLIDLVGTNNASKSFVIVENEGGLTFDATIHLRPVEHPDAQPIIADFDNDGLNDFGVRRNITGVGVFFSVYRGLGDTVFSKTPIDTQISTDGIFHARDINHDGILDLLNLLGHCIVSFGNGDGTFGPEITSPLSVFRRHRIVDLNLDGDLDVVWLDNGHPSDIVVTFGNSDGTFGPTTTYTDVAEVESIGVGDITGDGAPEVITGHRYGVISIHSNAGDGTFGVRRDIVVEGELFDPLYGSISIADFDGDGDNDFVAAGFSLDMFYNPGDGNVPDLPLVVSDYAASELVATDIDQDGTLDLYGESSRAVVWLNTAGTGAFNAPLFLRLYDSPAQYMVVADANNDGRDDVMIHPENSWSQYLFLNLPPTSTDTNQNAVLDECEAVFGDVTGNGAVTFDDVVEVINAFGPCDDPQNCPADVNNSGEVNIDDLIAVLNAIGGMTG